MLKYKDLRNKEKSKFICDRCGKEVSANERIGIFQKKFSDIPRHSWDLCSHCNKLLEKGIEKYIINQKLLTNHKKGEN